MKSSSQLCPRKTPAGIRVLALGAALALGAGLAQAQTSGPDASRPVSPFSAMGQSTAPHTTNSQSAVSSDRNAQGASTATGASGSGMNNGTNASGTSTELQGRSNIPPGTPGAADGKHRKGHKNANGNRRDNSATASDLQGRSNLPHATPGAPKTDPSSTSAR